MINFKKLLVLFVVFCMVSTSVTVLADTSGDFEYSVVSNKITITKCYATDEHVTIPSEINSMPVIRLGSSAFSGLSSLVSVDIPDSVEVIGSGAFSNCRRLTDVNMPANLASIGASAFVGCGGLTNLTIPDTVRSIGVGAFSLCTSLESVVLGSGINAIAPNTFRGCNSLSMVYIPKSVKQIQQDAFYGCNSLSIKYEGSEDEWNTILKSYPNDALDNAPKTFNSPNPNGACGENLSYDISSDNILTISGSDEMTNWDTAEDVPWHSVRSSISGIVIGDEVTSIGKYAFSNMPCLTEINIGTSVSRIEENAFAGCVNLQNVYIPISVNDICDNAFFDCSGIAYSYYEGSEENWRDVCVGSDNENLTDHIAYYYGNVGACGENMTWEFPGDGTLIIKGHGDMDNYEDIESVPWSSLRENITTIHIDSGVNSVGDYAFWGLSELTDIVFYDGENTTNENHINRIGVCAFSGCNTLNELPEFNELSVIDDYAFDGCSNLESVTFPYLESIGEYAFKYCCSLESVGDGAYRVEKGAFYDCQRLAGFELSENQTVIEEETFYGCNSFTEFDFHNRVTHIGNSAFGNCINLANINGFSEVETIGDCAFVNCESLTEIPDSNRLENIGNAAFRQCSNIEAQGLAHGVVSVGHEAFRGCDRLVSFEIPSSVSYIGEAVFANTMLESIIVDRANQNYCSENGVLFDKAKTRLICFPAQKNSAKYTIADTVVEIAPFAFGECEYLQEIEIPEGVKKIGEHAFVRCVSLTSVVIPDSVEEIADPGVFGECFNLQSAVIGSGVPYIVDDMFYMCQRLTDVVIRGDIERVGRGAFGDCESLANITLPDSVTYIGEYAFGRCVALENITIPDSVTEIAQSAFYECSGLVSVTVGDSVEMIWDQAFQRCENLTSVTLPHSLRIISHGAFEGCENIKKVYYNGRPADWREIDFTGGNDKVTGVAREYFCWVSFYDNEGEFLYKAKNTLNMPIFACNIPVDENEDLVKVYKSPSVSESDKFDLSANITENTDLYIKKINGTKTLVSDTSEMVEQKTMFTIKGMHMKTGSVVILALYNNGKFVGVQDAVYYHGDIIFTTDIEHTSAKVMVWDNMGNMRPQNKAENVMTKEN